MHFIIKLDKKKVKSCIHSTLKQRERESERTVKVPSGCSVHPDTGGPSAAVGTYCGFFPAPSGILWFKNQVIKALGWASLTAD